MQKGDFMTEILKNNSGWENQYGLKGSYFFDVEMNIQTSRSKKNHTIPIAASAII